MFKLVVIIRVKADKAAEFEEMVKPLVKESRKEKGNISYDLLPDVLHQNCYIVLETWESDKALEAHKQTRHYLDFIESLNEYTNEPPTLHRVEPDKISLF